MSPPSNTCSLTSHKWMNQSFPNPRRRLLAHTHVTRKHFYYLLAFRRVIVSKTLLHHSSSFSPPDFFISNLNFSVFKKKEEETGRCDRNDCHLARVWTTNAKNLFITCVFVHITHTHLPQHHHHHRSCLNEENKKLFKLKKTKKNRIV